MQQFNPGNAGTPGAGHQVGDVDVSLTELCRFKKELDRITDIFLHRHILLH